MKFIHSLLILLPIFLLTSCFEVIEDVSVNRDGTGKAKDKVQNSLVAAQGISDVDVLSDYTDYIFEIVCDFENVQSLNKAINKVADDLNDSSMPTVKMDNFALSNQSFKRLFKYPINLPNYDELPTIFQFMMETATFTGIYRFDKTVGASSNKAAQVSPSGKAVKMQSNLSALVKKENSIANEISFK